MSYGIRFIIIFILACPALSSGQALISDDSLHLDISQFREKSSFRITVYFDTIVVFNTISFQIAEYSLHNGQLYKMVFIHREKEDFTAFFNIDAIAKCANGFICVNSDGLISWISREGIYSGHSLHGAKCIPGGGTFSQSSIVYSPEFQIAITSLAYNREKFYFRPESKSFRTKMPFVPRVRILHAKSIVEFGFESSISIGNFDTVYYSSPLLSHLDNVSFSISNNTQTLFVQEGASPVIHEYSLSGVLLNSFGNSCSCDNTNPEPISVNATHSFLEFADSAFLFSPVYNELLVENNIVCRTIVGAARPSLLSADLLHLRTKLVPTRPWFMQLYRLQNRPNFIGEFEMPWGFSPLVFDSKGLWGWCYLFDENDLNYISLIHYQFPD
jgi:hypothetical protein